MKRERDPNILGLPVRPGRPRADPLASPKLSPAQERELADAEAGKLEWVSPAVAAFKLGITVDALAKRRQLGHPDTPPWKQTTPGGKVFYRWDYFHRIRPAQHSEVESLRQRVTSLEGMVVALLRHAGVSLDALNTMALWAVDERERLVGHASLLEAADVVAYTWLEALQQPWTSEEARAPYDVAMRDLLNDIQPRVMG